MLGMMPSREKLCENVNFPDLCRLEEWTPRWGKNYRLQTVRKRMIEKSRDNGEQNAFFHLFFHCFRSQLVDCRIIYWSPITNS